MLTSLERQQHDDSFNAIERRCSFNHSSSNGVYCNVTPKQFFLLIDQTHAHVESFVNKRVQNTTSEGESEVTFEVIEDRHWARNHMLVQSHISPKVNSTTSMHSEGLFLAASSARYYQSSTISMANLASNSIREQKEKN